MKKHCCGGCLGPGERGQPHLDGMTEVYRPISLWKRARILKKQLQWGDGQIQAASLGFLWELEGTKHSCFVPLVWTDGMKRGNKPAILGLRVAFCNGEVMFLWGAWLLQHGFSPLPHDESARDYHPETPRQCEMGREMGIVRQPRQGPSLSEQRSWQDHGSSDPSHGASTESFSVGVLWCLVHQSLMFLLFTR